MAFGLHTRGPLASSSRVGRTGTSAIPLGDPPACCPLCCRSSSYRKRGCRSGRPGRRGREPVTGGMDPDLDLCLLPVQLGPEALHLALRPGPLLSKPAKRTAKRVAVHCACMARAGRSTPLASRPVRGPWSSRPGAAPAARTGVPLSPAPSRAVGQPGLVRAFRYAQTWAKPAPLEHGPAGAGSITHRGGGLHPLDLLRGDAGVVVDPVELLLQLQSAQLGLRSSALRARIGRGAPLISACWQ